jgi:hypothetical protein
MNITLNDEITKQIVNEIFNDFDLCIEDMISNNDLKTFLEWVKYQFDSCYLWNDDGKLILRVYSSELASSLPIHERINHIQFDFEKILDEYLNDLGGSWSIQDMRSHLLVLEDYSVRIKEAIDSIEKQKELD